MSSTPSLVCTESISFEHGAPLPHILIHGAPGSGKTLLAKRLARMFGMRSAVVSGGDIGPLGALSSSELSRLMHWAGAGKSFSGSRGRDGRRYGAGVVLIFDEAEAALGNRGYVYTHVRMPFCIGAPCPLSDQLPKILKDRTIQDVHST